MSASAARVAHVNLMTDTVIANLNTDTLRVILRSMLVADEQVAAPTTCSNISDTIYKERPFRYCFRLPTNLHQLHQPHLLHLLLQHSLLQSRRRNWRNYELLAEVVRQSRALQLNGRTFEGERLAEVLVAVDGDLVQALTAVQKVVTTNNWGKTGEIPAARLQILLSLRTDLKECRERNEGLGVEFGFGRGSMMLENILSTVSE
ncbi:hypothetical protein RJZ56_006122 [Blastomyces dermatitidis]